jgi:hypothetical protein
VIHRNIRFLGTTRRPSLSFPDQGYLSDGVVWCPSMSCMEANHRSPASQDPSLLGWMMFSYSIELCSAVVVTCCARVCVQGNCSTSPPAGNSGRPLAALHPGQCVLTTELSIFSWVGIFAPRVVWLHGLYFYIPGDSSNDTASSLYWNTAQRSLSRLYMTHVTIQGGQWGFVSNGTVYMQGKNHNA